MFISYGLWVIIAAVAAAAGIWDTAIYIGITNRTDELCVVRRYDHDVRCEMWMCDVDVVTIRYNSYYFIETVVH